MTEPIKGTEWEHPTRTDWQGNPKRYKVTSVQTRNDKRMVYSRDEYGDTRKSSVAWFTNNAKILSVPEPSTSGTVRLTETQCAELFAQADAAGKRAADACVPVPMTVIERANPFDDTSAIVREYAPVNDGVCGFAWVTVRPGTSSFARYLTRAHGARKDYYGGTAYWVSAYNQSMERKYAYARAFADVLSASGINAYPNSRMD